MARTKKQLDAPETNHTPFVTNEPAPAAPMPNRTHAPRRARRGLVFWILLLALIGVSYWAFTLHKQNEELRDPEAQARRIVAEMQNHIILPEDEVPGVFPIDKSQATEPFFKNAQDGDLLVVYRSTQQAFIYSPGRKILVNAGVLVVNPEEAEVPSGADEEPEPEPEEEAVVEEEI